MVGSVPATQGKVKLFMVDEENPERWKNFTRSGERQLCQLILEDVAAFWGVLSCYVRAPSKNMDTS